MKAIDLRRSLATLADPPPALSVWAWAEARRVMGRDVTAKPGQYSVEFAPYQREPQESFTDPEVQTTVLYFGKRLGKTEMLCNLSGAIIEQDPRNILHVSPTLDSSRKHRKQFINPMIRSTPELKKLVRETRTKDADNTLLAFGYPGGVYSMIGANSPIGFRQVQAPVVLCDEIDSMENGPEGDPVFLAFGRSENYGDCIQVVSSTATFLETSRIHAWYERSDKRQWFAKGPCCGAFHVLAWGNMKWSEGKSEEVWYECPECKARWDDKMRLQAVRAGEWRATAPFKGIRGYWLNGLNTVFPAKKGFKTKLHQFAKDYLDAEAGGESAMLAWRNTFLCEPDEIKGGEIVESEPLLARREDYGPENLPDSVLIAACAIDVQADRIEYEITGWGENEESWGIEYGRLAGNPEQESVWRSLGSVLARKFHRQDGTEIGIACSAIDHRHKGHMVRQFIRTCGLPRVWPVYGSASSQSVLVVARPNKFTKMLLYSVGTDLGKDAIFARLQITEPGPRYMHFPKGNGYDGQFFDGLTAEEVRIKYVNGFAKRYYWKNPSKRNEPLDLRVYGLAALAILKPVYPKIREKLGGAPTQPENVNHGSQTESEDPMLPPAMPANLRNRRDPFPKFRPFRKSGWLNGWR